MINSEIKEIGGFFQIEKNEGTLYYENSIKLNSARNSLEYLVISKEYKKIYLPFYICDSLIEPLKRNNIEFEFYNINEKLEPIFEKKILSNEALVIVNYYNSINKNILKKYKKQNIIFDNTQAFFRKPIKGIDTIYSCRKFFPVSDGGLLMSDCEKLKDIIKDKSSDRIKFLFKRFEEGANLAYDLYQQNEEIISQNSIREMSDVTENILCGINYKKTKKIREKNFKYLHDYLKEYNQLKIDFEAIKGPMVYPFLIEVNGIREYLVENKIYVGTLWKEVLSRVEKESFESQLTKYLIPLPIDQRYNEKAMDYIVKILEKKLTK